MHPRTHAIHIEGLTRELPITEVAPGVRVALFNMLGDAPITVAAAKGLARKLPTGLDTLVTAEAKAIPLAHALSLETGLPYVVLRKTRKPYMLDALASETRSITTGSAQTLWLDGKDRATIHGKRIALVDDVVSTGSTLEAMRALVARAGGTVAAEAAVFTEGDARRWSTVLSLGHLPLY